MGFPAVPAPIAGSVASSQGRPNFTVLSFVSTFSAPLISSVAPSPSSTAAGLSSRLPSSLPVPPLPALQQSFVLPLGYSPVPPKLVNQIVSNKFVEFSDLLSKNIEQSQTDNYDPQLCFDGRFYLTSTPKKPKRRIEDISGWMEAFSVYCCVLMAHFPTRAKDLLLYQMMILRTHRQFTGRVWLSYDRAFCEHAAATNLTDWSEVNTQLFHFHSAGASVRGLAEPRRPSSSADRGITAGVLPHLLSAVFRISVSAALASIEPLSVLQCPVARVATSPNAPLLLLRVPEASLGDLELL